MAKLPKYQWLWLLAMLLATVYILHREKTTEQKYHTIHGRVFGTVYTITYRHSDDLQTEIDQEFKRIDGSLSPFNTHSIITKVNNNEEVEVDSLFRKVFVRSMEVSAETGGAFDITVAPLVNVWHFGFKQEAWPSAATIDSLLQITGYEKVTLAGARVVKRDARIMLNCSAIAKGYAADVIGYYFDRKGVKDYMVEIGGEIVVKGKNSKNELWRIGINKPEEDSLSVGGGALYTKIQLTGAGMATSGNYRNYYYKDGKKYAHTIDPHTGYPVNHNLLSTTVIAADCMSADAYATAFMVMGLDKAKAFADARTDIAVYLIYSDEQGELKSYYTKGMEKYLK